MSLPVRIALPVLAAILLAWTLPVGTQSPSSPAAPRFHHLHFNSVDPSATIAAYLKLWPTSLRRTTVAGFDALENGGVSLLFTKVPAAAPTRPQSAFRHGVWLTPDVRAYVARARAAGMTPQPLYVSDEGGTVEISSDSFPGTLTRSGLAEAKQKGLTPTRQAGFTYVQGPDHHIVEGFERAGEMDRLAQIDMWQEHPVCAELWYVAHLGATSRPPRGGGPAPTEATCRVAPGEPSWPSQVREGTKRTPSGRAGYGDIALFWYSPPGGGPLASTRGQVMDHLAFVVDDLDAWLVKLRREKISVLGEPYAFGGGRAVLIEGPSREAIELLEERRR